MLGNMLAGKRVTIDGDGVIRAGGVIRSSGKVIWAGEGVIRAGQSFNAASSFNLFWNTKILLKRTWI